MKKKRIILVFVLCAFMLIGCGEKRTENNTETDVPGTTESGTADTAVKTENPVSADSETTGQTSSDLSITRLNYTSGGYAYFTIKNDGENNVSCIGKALFLDKNGETLNEATVEYPCIPAKEAILLPISLEPMGVTEAADIKLQLNTNETKRESIWNSLSVIVHEETGCVTISNKGEQALTRPVIYLAMMNDKDEVIDMVQMDAYDRFDGILAAGETVYRELSLPADYTYYCMYGSMSYETVPETSGEEEDLLSGLAITRYMIQTEDGTTVYAIVKNTNKETVLLRDNAVFTSFELIRGVATTEEVTLVGPGETGVVISKSNFAGSGDSITYKTVAAAAPTDEYSLGGSVHTEKKEDPENVFVTFYNDGTEKIRAGACYAFVFDNNRQLVNVVSCDATGLAAGESVTFNVAKGRTDSVELYWNVYGGGDI